MTAQVPPDRPHRRQDERPYDLVVLGASGVTGRCVVRHLSERDARAAREGARPLRWAAAGRDLGRVRAATAAAGAPSADVVQVDLTDLVAVRALLAQTHLVLNVAGPFTPTAEAVVEACVATGTHYVDVSGELPLLRRVDRRFDRAARAAGVCVVQMAGWEAMPADTTALVASARALGLAGEDGGARSDGPGAGAGIAAVHVGTTFLRTPAVSGGISGSVSGGTLASITAQLGDEDAALVGDVAGLLPEDVPAEELLDVSPLRLRPHRHRGRLFAPVVPVAFLDPPVVHRTAALLAREQHRPYEPARFVEGTDVGPADGPAAVPAFLRAASQAVLQRTVLGLATSPRAVRGGLVRVLDRVAPPPGTGPTGPQLTDWAWQVRADAVTTRGHRASATLRGTGHPGYTATAAIATAVAVAVLQGSTARTGCVTPALALGVQGSLALDAPELRLG